MKDSLNVFHFSVGKEGGVHTIIKNLIKFSNNEHVSNKILYLKKDNVQSDLRIDESIEYSFISYSSSDNIYYTLKKIESQIGCEDAILACHDWLELALVSNLGLHYPVVFFIHGDYPYYYETAIKNESAINIFLAPTLSIINKLEKYLPHRKTDFIFQPFPVFNMQLNPADQKEIHCAYYVSDLTDSNKNFDLLPKLDQSLKSKGYRINWHIGGGGISIDQFNTSWQEYDFNRIKFYGYLDTDTLSNFLESTNIFILPSLKEGMPISLIESMQTGLVPIVNNWNDSISELIIDGKNGFIVDNNSIKRYVDIIIFLSNNPEIFKKISDNAKFTTSKINDIATTIGNIESIFINLKDLKTNRKPNKVYGSRLDNPIIPNFISKMIRKTRHYRLW